MESMDQVNSSAWRLWAKLVSPALLRYPVLSISTVLVVSAPIAAAARTLPRSPESTSAEHTQRQMRVLRSYERYLSRVRAQTVRARRAVQFAYRQVGKPYQWGGAGPRSYDCSGLVMAAWRKGGISMPHRADLQHRMLRRRVGIKSLQPGDLVFFSGDHHVGIYVGRHQFLHAPHTGARIQRGSLSGWRLRSFAGAARPGAPAYHAWPHWVRALEGQTEADSAARPHHRHPVTGEDAVPSQPPSQPPNNPNIEFDTQPFDDGLTTPYDQWDRSPADPGVPGSGPLGLSGGLKLAHLPVLMSAAARHAHSGHRTATPLPDPGPTPPPAANATPGAATPPPAPVPTRPRANRPGETVKRQNDEQRFDRDFDSGDAGPDDDAQPDGEGIDWNRLLGDTP
jgi:cell wall-associated NlpC family hydrolase